MRILAEIAEDQKHEHFLVYLGQRVIYPKNVESLNIKKQENRDIKRMVKNVNGK